MFSPQVAGTRLPFVRIATRACGINGDSGSHHDDAAANAGQRGHACPTIECRFVEVYTHGFQAASVDHVLDQLNLIKGAFFHHLPNKRAFGCALVDEVIAGMIRAQWVEPLAGSEDPLTTIGDAFDGGCGGCEPGIDPRAEAFAIVAQIEGILSLAKNSQDARIASSSRSANNRRALRLGLATLRAHLDSLRVAEEQPKRSSRRRTACR